MTPHEEMARDKLLAGDSIRLRFLNKKRLADAMEIRGYRLTHAQGGEWVALKIEAPK